MDDMKQFVPGYGSESNVGRLLLVISLFLILIPGLIAGKTARLLLAGEVTDAQISSVHEQVYQDKQSKEEVVDYIPSVAFQVKDKDYSVELPRQLTPPNVGEKVKIRYLKSDPQQAVSDGFSRTPVYTCAIFILIGFLVCFRALQMLRNRV